MLFTINMKKSLTGISVIALAMSFTCSRQKDKPIPPPDNAIVLFDGSNFSSWTDQNSNDVIWKIVDDAAEVVPLNREDFGESWPDSLKKKGIQTKRNFQDFKMHVEFRVPPGKDDNSGVYIQRRYEIQIVDSWEGREHPNNCGAIYKQKQPDVNASRPPGEWQTYDIDFRAARFAKVNGLMKKMENARVSVVHNGILIHDDVEIVNKTGVGDPEGPDPAPILLQDHGSLTRFRNVWIVPGDH
ncbi:hypothetical protein BVY01_01025 [bacterium I07]|nr:hypothetical protein BVY01_01025 [bacterium I07]